MAFDGEGFAAGRLVEDTGHTPEPEGVVHVEARREPEGVRLSVRIDGAPPRLKRRVVVHDGPRQSEHVDEGLGDVVVRAEG